MQIAGWRTVQRFWRQGGWSDSSFLSVVRETYEVFKTREVSTRSQALGFALIIAFVPLLAVAFTFFKAFGGLSVFVEETLKPLANNHFGVDTGRQLGTMLDRFVDSLNVQSIGAIAFVALLITVIGFLQTLEDALNKIFEVERERSLLQQFVRYWVMITLPPLLFLVTSTQLSSLFSGETDSVFVSNVANVAHGIIRFILQSAMFSLVYAFFPNIKVTIRSALIAGLVASFLFYGLQILNVWLTKRMLSNAINERFYGTAPLLGLILFYWFRLAALIVLLGACLARVIHTRSLEQRQGTMKSRQQVSARSK